MSCFRLFNSDGERVGEGNLSQFEKQMKVIAYGRAQNTAFLIYYQLGMHEILTEVRSGACYKKSSPH
nr:hypothetical protein [Tanacetum cinerariifolium]